MFRFLDPWETLLLDLVHFVSLLVSARRPPADHNRFLPQQYINNKLLATWVYRRGDSENTEELHPQCNMWSVVWHSGRIEHAL